MPISDHRRTHSVGKQWRLCPFWQSGTPSSSSSSSPTQNLQPQSAKSYQNCVVSSSQSSSKVSLVAKTILPARRRLRLDPSNNLYFPYEPGKQVKSAVRIKNQSSSHVAFKFQTTAPKSCYMRPPGGILAPGESIIATVFKFVEQPDKNEKQPDKRCKVKFKIMSLKVKEGTDFVPEMFDEQKDEVVIERILRVIFLNAERPTPALQKLKHQLAEAEVELELRKKPQVDTSPKVVAKGLVIDEWAARALANFAAHGDSNSNNAAVGQEARVLAALIQLTRSPKDGVSLPSLWNLSFDDGNLEATASVGGVEALVYVMSATSKN